MENPKNKKLRSPGTGHKTLQSGTFLTPMSLPFDNLYVTTRDFKQRRRKMKDSGVVTSINMQKDAELLNRTPRGTSVPIELEAKSIGKDRPVAESPLLRRIKKDSSSSTTPILAEEVLLGRHKDASPRTQRDFVKARKLAELKNIPTMGFFKTSHLLSKPPIEEQIVSTNDEQLTFRETFRSRPPRSARAKSTRTETMLQEWVAEKIKPRLDEEFSKFLELQAPVERRILQEEEDFDLNTLNDMICTNRTSTMEFVSMLEMKLSEIYMNRKSPFLNLGDKYLPLELFIDMEEDRTNLEWLKLSQKEHGGKGKGKCVYINVDGKPEWVPCIVKSYNEQLQLFTVAYVSSGIKKNVRRLGLMFDGEDEAEFKQKLLLAQRLRKEAQRRIVTENFLISELGHLYKEKGLEIGQIQRILAMVKPAMMDDTYVKQFLYQCNAMHDFASLKSILYFFWDEAFIKKVREVYDLIGPTKPLYVDCGCHDVGYTTPRRNQRRKIHRNLILNNLTYLKCLQDLQASYHKVLEWRRLFEFPLSSPNLSNIPRWKGASNNLQEFQASLNTTPIKFNTFLHIQSHVINQFCVAASSYYVTNAADRIRSRIGKMVELDLKSIDIEELPKNMKQLLNIFNYQMEAAVLNSVLISIEDYAFMLYSYALRTPKYLGEMFDESIVTPLSENALINVKMSSIKLDRKLCIAPSPTIDRMTRKLMELPVLMIDQLRRIECIEFRIFTHLTGAKREFIRPPELDTNERLAEIMKRVETILTRYTAKIEQIYSKMLPYEYLLNISEKGLIKQIKQKAHARIHELTEETPVPEDAAVEGEGEDQQEEEEQEPIDEAELERSRQEKYRVIQNELIVEQLKKIREDYAEITKIKRCYDIGIFFLSCDKLRSKLLSKSMLMESLLLDQLTNDLAKDIERLTDAFKEMHSFVSRKVSNIDDIAEINAFVEESLKDGGRIEHLEEEVKSLSKKMKVIHKFKHTVRSDLFTQYFNLFRWPRDIKSFFANRVAQLADENVMLIDDMKREISALERNISDYSDEFERFKTIGICKESENPLDYDYIITISEIAHRLKKNLEDSRELSEIYNRRERLLGFSYTQFPHLIKMISDGKPYFKLWKIIDSFKGNYPIWTEGSFHKVNCDKILTKISKWSRQLHKFLSIDFPEQEVQLELTRCIIREVDEFKSYLPMIQALKNQGLRDRHWSKIKTKVQFNMGPDQPFTLMDLISEKMHKGKNLKNIIGISEQASKEMIIEKTLDSLEKEWRNMQFRITQYRNTHIKILTGVDDIYIVLEDNIMKMQTIKASPFIDAFRERILNWEYKLKMINEILDEWMRAQKYWLYLEPIFALKEVMLAMPEEDLKYKEIEESLRTIMDDIESKIQVINITYSDWYLPFFQKTTKECEEIIVKLNKFLDGKRIYFPRFFFLSNDEILDMLGITRNFDAVQRHMHKIFNGISKLTFTPGKSISGMSSDEGEVVAFRRNVQQSELIEEWLKNLQDIITTTLRRHILIAIRDYYRQPLTDWVFEWPNQVILEVLKIVWASNTRDILGGYGEEVMFGQRNVSVVVDEPELGWIQRSKGNKFAPPARTTSSFIGLNDEEHVSCVPGHLQEYLERLNLQIDDAVFVIRSNTNKLWKLNLANIAICMVYNRDKIKYMVDTQVTSDKCFEWQVMLKHFLTPDQDIYVSSLDIDRRYSYEYAGSSQNLIITPLTEKCHRSMLSAIWMHYAASPSGPAGTGKTETTKELAREFANYCIVFNCSEGLDSITMGMFFKGLVICGAWSCFDEFNRIEVDTLAIISQQILTLMMALKAQKSSFEFEDLKITLDPNFAVFCTMNPQYEGRSQLPDSLQNQIRPIAMMIPDYQIISETIFYVSGFSNAKELAKKLVTSFKLSTAQLSQQQHYDFGLRAVKSVLIAASNLRTLDRLLKDQKLEMSHSLQEDQDELAFAKSASLMPIVEPDVEHCTTNASPEQEAALLLHAIHTVTLPKLVPRDAETFKFIMDDLFPGVDYTYKKKPTKFDKALSKQIDQNGLKPDQEYITEKVRQIDTNLKIRPGLMLIGDSMSGKTTCLKILYDVLNTLKIKEIEKYLEDYYPDQLEKMQNENQEAQYDERIPYKAMITEYKHLFTDLDETDADTMNRYAATLGITLEQMRLIKYSLQNTGVIQHTFNPKAYSLERLFGYFEDTNHDWHDGLVSSVLRTCIADRSRRRKWLVFDGPIDVYWVENLNTALDDNRKLCLNSGETIRILEDMNIIFEVDNLEAASPATISRCGMIYISPENINLVSLFNQYCWCQIPEFLKQYAPMLDTLFKWIVLPAVHIVQTSQTHTTASPHWLVTSFIKLFDSFVSELKYKDSKKKKEKHQAELEASMKPTRALDKLKDIQMSKKSTIKSTKFIEGAKSGILILEGYFVFSVIWTFGGILNDIKDRAGFDMFLRERLNISTADAEAPTISSAKSIPKPTVFQNVTEKHFEIPDDIVERPQMSISLLRRQSVYEIVFDTDKVDWIPWDDYYQNKIYELTSQVKSSLSIQQLSEDIVVNTIDVIRYTYLIQFAAKHRKNLLLMGPTGTGKTVVLKHYVEGRITEDIKFQPLQINFSANTESHKLQRIIQSKLERQRKGLYAPPLEKQLVVIADDLHMPKKEATGGAQPPLELIRLWMDYQGWHDYSYADFINTENIQFIGSLTTQGNQISDRVKRHFLPVFFNTIQDTELAEIFATIFQSVATRFPEKATRNIDLRIIGATISVYRAVLKNLKPTPTRITYVFSIREISKVISGFQILDRYKVGKKEHVVKLWYHECLRVFSDRLQDTSEQLWFLDKINEIAVAYFKSLVYWVDPKVSYQESPEVHPTGLPLYGFPLSDGIASSDYCEVADQKDTMTEMDVRLKAYAEEHSPLSIFMFQFSMEHVLRICRILKLTDSHMLLVGLGGSGKMALCQLACYIMNIDAYTIEIKKNFSLDDWKDELKKILKRTGCADEKRVLILDDIQITHEGIFEDINSLLKSGEIPMLFTLEEEAALNNEIQGRNPDLKTTSKQWNHFLHLVKQNLTVCTCLSPIGAKFRTRVRMYPSLVQCTTINWLNDWPKEALYSVATEFLKEQRFVDPETYESISHVCVSVYTDAKVKAQELLAKEGRHVYITPYTYMQALNNFKLIFDQKSSHIMNLAERYENSINTIEKTKKSLQDMQRELEINQQFMSDKAIELSALLENIEAQTEILNEKQTIILDEEKVALEQTADAMKIKKECEIALLQVVPHYEQAKQDIKALSKLEITELKSMKSPPWGVKRVMEAVCKLLNVKPSRFRSPKTGEYVNDYWPSAISKSVLGDPKLLDRLVHFSKDKIKDEILHSINEFISTEEFAPEAIKRTSIAAASMAHWVRAIINYAYVMRDIEPKQKSVREANKICRRLETKLSAKRAELQALEDQLNLLVQNKILKDKDMSQKFNFVKDAKERIARAQTLNEGLGWKSAVWTDTCRQLRNLVLNLAGDGLLATSIINYLGPFPPSFREPIVQNWQMTVVKCGVNSSENFSLSTLLGDNVLMRQWIMKGLPADEYSIDNAIMIHNSKRFCLVIDPQLQALNWIKNAEKKLEVTNFLDPKFMRVIENNIQFGGTAMLVNIGETVDALLLPLLRQEIRGVNAKSIKLNENDLAYNTNFRLILQTRQHNPHYMPELQSYVNLLNFSITPEGLLEQLLKTIVFQERADLEQKRHHTIQQCTKNKKELRQMEEEIVEKLNSVEGDILEDEQLIKDLNVLKSTAEDITIRIRTTEATQVRINKAREVYMPVANRACSLFFSATTLSALQPTYQYALKSMLKHVKDLLVNDEQESYTWETRVPFITNIITQQLFEKICQSLFEKDKLVFAMLLSLRIIQQELDIPRRLIEFLLNWDSKTNKNTFEKPKNADWITDEMWANICTLSKVYPFKRPSLASLIYQNPQIWYDTYIVNEDPHIAEIPGEYLETEVQEDFGEVQEQKEQMSSGAIKRSRESYALILQLCMLKCFRPDKLTNGFDRLIETTLKTSPSMLVKQDLKTVHSNSKQREPILIFHSQVYDPVKQIYEIAKAHDMKGRVISITVVPGQYKTALKAIERSKTRGEWILIQNIHLAKGFITLLDNEIDEITEDKHVHSNFKLWLTSATDTVLPAGILHNSVKIMFEPTGGLKQKIQEGLNATKDAFDDTMPTYWENYQSLRQMIFGISYFHAVIQERGKYGSLGWNSPYVFTESDFNASLLYLNYYSGLYYPQPYDMFKYCIGELVYGGRIIDPQDQILLQTLLDDIVISKKPNYSCIPEYCPPFETEQYQDYIEHLERFPEEDAPQALGLDLNAQISLRQQEGYRVFSLISHILKTSELVEDSNQDKADITLKDDLADRIKVLTNSILARIDEIFDEAKVSKMFPNSYEDSLNAVLNLEIQRYNRLLTEITICCKHLVVVTSGDHPISVEYEKICNELLMGKVPSQWLKLSYLTDKPVAAYIEDLYLRIAHLHEWIDKGKRPNKLWLSVFFFPQGLLTSVLQNYGRKYSMQIDDLVYKQEILPQEPTEWEEDGCYIQGLYLEGARFTSKIEESDPRVLFTLMPLIYFRPAAGKLENREDIYNCPVYKIVQRAGKLNSMGLSDNYICNIELPTDEPVAYWIKRSVALICST